MITQLSGSLVLNKQTEVVQQPAIEKPVEKQPEPVSVPQPVAEKPVQVEVKKVERLDKNCSPIKEIFSRPPSSPAFNSNAAEIEIIKENYEYKPLDCVKYLTLKNLKSICKWSF